MGSGASALSVQVRKFIQTEFEKAKRSQSRDYLTLDEIMRMQAPPILPIDFTHLGTLFAINRHNLDGRFTLEELNRFADLCDARRKMYPSHEFLFQIQSLCTLRMWQHAAQHGNDAVEAWLLRCIYENGPLYCFDAHPEIVFVGRDSLMPLYKMLRLDRVFGISFQDWFDLVQHAAEESSGIDMINQAYDDVVPELVLQQFLASMMQGFMKLSADVGLNEEPR